VASLAFYIAPTCPVHDAIILCNVWGEAPPGETYAGTIARKINVLHKGFTSIKSTLAPVQDFHLIMRIAIRRKCNVWECLDVMSVMVCQGSMP
jgi:hypothetical protein